MTEKEIEYLMDKLIANRDWYTIVQLKKVLDEYKEKPNPPKGK